jgi:hypothetical protein
MSNADWYARKLGGQQQAPQQQPVYQQPQQQYSQVAVQNRPMQAGQHTNPYQQQQPRDMTGIPLNEGERQELLNPELPGDATIGFSEALRRWRGGIAHRTEGNQTCPSCGSRNVSHRAAGAIAGNTPAPHCFGCGWNGKFQQGDQASWVA